MTGEITLTGRILPVGGVKEKILAAHRNKIDTVVLPELNRKDLDDLPKEVSESLSFIFADSISAALPSLFPAGSFVKKRKTATAGTPRTTTRAATPRAPKSVGPGGARKTKA